MRLVLSQANPPKRPCIVGAFSIDLEDCLCDHLPGIAGVKDFAPLEPAISNILVNRHERVVQEHIRNNIFILFNTYLLSWISWSLTW